MHAGKERAHLVEDLGALRLVDALNSEVLDGLLLPPLIHRLRSTQPPAPNHKTNQRRKNTEKARIARAGARATPIPADPGRKRGKSGTETIRSGGEGSEESYRVLAAADGLVDMEVVHSREAGGGGGAPLSSPVRLGFEIRGAEACGRTGGGRRGGICG